ncbi:MAG: copper amine oxidase N-terminal domain-containing protein [Clostridiaceae bacterium]|nr:copper amine oxidase N-terminal domain-containing protein [Clostridiaceae bacterium]
MKRITTITLVLLLCFLYMTVHAWADTYNIPAMVLKENSEVYKVNGKEIKFEKPYLEGDTIMADLDPIVKALGLTLEKSPDGKTITLEYSGSTIVMNLGSKDAIVDGTKTAIPEAPVSVNGSIMVPLRFVVENFGGEVSVDSKTQDITVIKESAGDNSIKDFSLLLKKTKKGIVGDSFYNWSIRLPKDVKISYRSFNGSYNFFEALDGSYGFSLSIFDLKSGESCETLFSDELQHSSNYTLISQEKSKKYGLDYFKLAYKDGSYIYEERDFIKGNKVYELYLRIWDTSKFNNIEELEPLLDSFIPEFKKDGSSEDLSDAAADGYRIYEDKKLKFSIKVPADWYALENDGKENQVTFTEPAKNGSSETDTLSISMFSLEDGFTLDKWNERDLKYIKDEFNPELVNILTSEEMTINSVKARKNIYSLAYTSKPAYTYDISTIGKNYRYKIRYTTNKPYDNAIAANDINNILKTFTFAEPNVEDVGSFLDPDSIAKPEGNRQVKSNDGSFSLKVPQNWINQTTTEGIVYYSNSSQTVSVIASAKKSVTEQQYLDYMDNNFKDLITTLGSYKNIKKQTLNNKGAKIIKHTADVTMQDVSASVQYYLCYKNSTVYEVVLYIFDISASEKNKKILSDIWDSVQFE